VNDVLVAAALTFAASAHCVGMCGGFVLAAAGPPARARLLVGQLLLQAGKAASYAFLGSLAGVLGAALLSSPVFRRGGRALALLAGVALILAGLTLLGLRSSRPGRVATALGALWARITGPLTSARTPVSSLLIGMAIGFLPCPLVYAGLAAAAATGSPARGAATMAGVALGTVPALALVAAFGSLLPLGARRLLARAAGVLLLAVGAITATRGLGLHDGHAGHVHVHEAAAPEAGRAATAGPSRPSTGAASGAPAGHHHH